MDPIKPSDVVRLKKDYLPAVLIEAVNDLIVRKFNPASQSASVKLKEIIELLCKRGVDTSDYYECHYFDFEDVFRDAGWSVTWDGPGYNETYDGYYVFKRR